MMKELIDLMNRRPAMNAGLVQEYAAWNAECYGVMEALSKTLANEDLAQEAADMPAGQKPRTPGSFVNAAGIHASDKPATVVRKLDAAFHDAVTFADTPAQAQGCTRSHPHENMSPMCVLRTEIARLHHAAAVAQEPAAPVAHPHHCTARSPDGACEECEGHAQAMAEWRADAAAPAQAQEDARDTERLDFVVEKDAFIVWTDRDGSIRQCQLLTQDHDENYHVLSGEHRYFNTPREAIDAARAAQGGCQAMSKAERLAHANVLIAVISRHGRRFFRNCETGTVARLELDGRGRVWWIDEYRGARIYTEKMMGCGHGWRGFSHGGTLRSLVESLRDYIKRGELLNPEFIAPSYVNSSYGDYWGYGAEAAAAVRAEAHQLPMFEQRAAAQKGGA